MSQYGGRRANDHPNADGEKLHTVFVGNLPYSALQTDVERIFSDLKPKAVRMVRDGETDKFKGFCYVEFDDYNSFQRALDYNNALYGDMQLRVNPAHDRRGRGRGGRQPGGFQPRDRDAQRSGDREAQDGAAGDDYDGRGSSNNGMYGERSSYVSSAGRGGRGRGSYRGGYQQYPSSNGSYQSNNYNRQYGDGDYSNGSRYGNRSRGGSYNDAFANFNMRQRRGPWNGDGGRRRYSGNQDDDRNGSSRRDSESSRGRERNESTTSGDPNAEVTNPSGANDEPAKDRPRLKLLPRSTNAPASDAGVSERSRAIFGGGRPRPASPVSERQRTASNSSNSASAGASALDAPTDSLAQLSVKD